MVDTPEQSVSPTHPAQLSPVSQPSAPVTQPVQKKSGLKWVLIGFILVLLIAGGGYMVMLSQKNSKVITSTMPIPTVSKPSPTPDSTANWQTYTNTKYNFSLKYPSNGYVQTDQGPSIHFANKYDPRTGGIPPYFIFDITITANPTHLATQQVVEKMLEITPQTIPSGQPTFEGVKIKKKQTMKQYSHGQVNGIQLKTFFEGHESGGYGEVVMAKGDYVYDFSINNGNGEVDASYEKMLDQILSTFTFIDQSQEGEKTTVKKYRDSDGYFSLQYPATWNMSYENTVSLGKNPSNRQDITFSGPEGKLDIHWVDAYGGACPPEYETMQIQGKSFQVCHTVDNPTPGTESWTQIVKVLDSKTNLGIYIEAFANNPAKNNRGIVLNILSTLTFAN